MSILIHRAFEREKRDVDLDSQFEMRFCLATWKSLETPFGGEARFCRPGWHEVCSTRAKAFSPGKRDCFAIWKKAILEQAKNLPSWQNRSVPNIGPPRSKRPFPQTHHTPHPFTTPKWPALPPPSPARSPPSRRPRSRYVLLLAARLARLRRPRFVLRLPCHLSQSRAGFPSYLERI